MKTPKKTGKKPEVKKPADKGVANDDDVQDDVKPSGKYDDDDDDYDLPLDEIDGFDDYRGGNDFDDDDDY